MAQTTVEKSINSTIAASTDDLYEYGTAKFDELVTQKLLELKQNVKGIKQSAKEEIAAMTTETTHEQLKSLLRDDYITFETHPLAQHITRQIMDNFNKNPPTPARPTSEFDDALMTAKVKIKIAVTEAIENVESKAQERQIEFEKLAKTHKDTLQASFTKAFQDLVTEGEQQKTIVAENRRLEEQQREENRRLETEKREEERRAQEAARATATNEDDNPTEQPTPTATETADTLGKEYATTKNPFRASGLEPTRPSIYNSYDPDNLRLKKIAEYTGHLEKFWEKFRAETRPQPIMDKSKSRTFYLTIFNNMSTYSLPIVPWEHLHKVRQCIDPMESARLETLMPGYVAEVSQKLFEKINQMVHEEDGPTQEAITAHSVMCDSYAVLYDIVKRHHDHLQDFPAKWSDPWKPGQSPATFFGSLTMKAEELKNQHNIVKSNQDLFVELLQRAAEIPRYNHVTGSLLGQLGLIGPVAFAGWSVSKLVGLLEKVDTDSSLQNTSATNQANTVINKMHA